MRIATIGCAVALLAGAGGRAQAAPPDLSGTWMAPFQIHAAGFPMLAGVTRWTPESAGDPRRQHIPTLAELMKQGDATNARLQATHGDPKVVRGFARPIPPNLLTDAGRDAAAHFSEADYQKQDLDCYPFNVFGRIGGGLGAMEIAESPSVIMMASEVNGHNFPRIIYMDGRTDANALPSWEGYSVGKWDNGVLHVVTTHIKGDFFNFNWPLSDMAKLTEDYRVQGTGRARKLEILQRLDDPTNYREPLTRVAYIDWRPDLELHDFPCEEGKDDQVEVTTSAAAAVSPIEAPHPGPSAPAPSAPTPAHTP